MIKKKATTKEIGDKWESKAKSFFNKKGYLFLQQNYRSGRNEIDLIFKDQKTIVFIEVKFRKNNYFGNAEDSVNEAKLDRLKDAAENYTYEYDWNGNIRFDILAITGKEILHFEDVY